MKELAVVVVRLTEAFTELWDQLARDLGLVLRTNDAEDSGPAASDVAVVLVAAGGGERQALEWLERHRVPRGVPVLVVGSDTGRRTATQIVAGGARDYFALPEDLEILRNALASAAERHREALRCAEASDAGSKAEAFDDIVGESKALKEVLIRAERILQHADATALIVGETGTGKELLAQAIHKGSARRRAPLVVVNCSALPEKLVESELFGHERGAFTDAHAAKPGLFEMADGGTLFLDEIGILPLDLQAKLLRVLEDRLVRRVGGTKSRRVDVRILAATNEDLDQALKDHTFRQDLYFRLSVITLSLPPLRERDQDVALIAEALLGRLAKHHGLPVPELTPPARRALLGYHWPGNVRELKNAVERSLLLSPPGELNVDELICGTVVETSGGGPIPFPAQLDDIAEAAAHATLALCDGNRSETARRLGISRRRLRRLLDGNGAPAAEVSTADD